MKTQRRFVDHKSVLVFIGFIVTLTLFSFNLFGMPFVLNIGIWGAIIFVGSVLNFRKRYRGPDYVLMKVIVIIFACSYLASTVVRFSVISNNIREWSYIFVGQTGMPAAAESRLGIPFPESTQFRYYAEGMPWLEQNAKLIAVVDQKDLAHVSKFFEQSDNLNKPKSKFWYIHYLFSKDKTVYTYSQFNKYGAVTADVLIVLQKKNKAKIFMDIIYW